MSKGSKMKRASDTPGNDIKIFCEGDRDAKTFVVIN